MVFKRLKIPLLFSMRPQFQILRQSSSSIVIANVPCVFDEFGVILKREKILGYLMLILINCV